MACADGTCRGGRALARSRGRRSLEDSDLGRQRDHQPWVATLRAHMMLNGVEQALADADAALDQLPADSWCVPTALLGRGVAQAALLASDQAVTALSTTVERGRPQAASKRSTWRTRCSRSSQQGRELGARQDDCAGGRSARRRVGPRRLLDECDRARCGSTCGPARGEGDGCPRVPGTCPSPTAHARPRHSMARRRSRHRAHAHPSRTGRGGRRPHDAPRDRAGAGTPPRHGRPRRGRARAARPPRGDLRAGRRVGDEPDGRRASAPAVPGDPPTIPEIATRLFISRNTVKTEAVSIYRKLSASSRSEAIERAVEVGLLESSIYPPAANLTQKG